MIRLVLSCSGIGVYVSALLFQHLSISPYIGSIPAGLFAPLVAWVVGYPCLRLRGPYFAVITLSFAFIVDLVVKNWHFLGGPEGLHLRHPVRDQGGGRPPFRRGEQSKGH